MTESNSEAEGQTALIEKGFLDDSTGEPLEVPLNYEIITLFSEGLYQSPYKAVEELVSNAYDAGAKSVRIVLPRDVEDGGEFDSLLVIDDGEGMDAAGFATLWRIAESPKANVVKPVNGRLPIGQFGIGKLAAYVLAWRLTHVSRRGGNYYYTSMDFHEVQNFQLNNASGPLELRLHTINKTQAQELLSEVKERDSEAWKLMFGAGATTTWTAAVLSDFKDLYHKLQPGRLSLVLRTGLPLASSFSIAVDATKLTPRAAEKNPLFTHKVGSNTDPRAKDLAEKYPGEVTTKRSALQIEGIDGDISGKASLYDKPLDAAKAGTQYHRTNGFFIRVRGRVINLDDELFGLEAQNHAAWSRFFMEVEADGLREHLLSSREGVKATRPVQIFRDYLRLKFNECRREFEKRTREERKGLDLEALLSGAPHDLLSDPFLDAVGELIDSGSDGSYYLKVPDVDESDRDAWKSELQDRVNGRPIEDISFEKVGPYARLAQWDAASLHVTVNEDHPFIAKLETHSRNTTPLTMVSAIEVATEVMLRQAGMRPADRIEFLETRDRLLRVLAGQQELNAADCLRELAIANDDEVALERAVGRAFSLLGLAYEQGGENQPGDDGFLQARLGVVDGKQAGYSVVYDAKSTQGSTVAAAKVDFGNLEKFRESKRADFAFFVAKQFAGQADSSSTINQKLKNHGKKKPATLVTIGALQRLVKLHMQHGVTLTRLRGLFECRTTKNVEKWLDKLESDLTKTRVPLLSLLTALDAAKDDEVETPTLGFVRAREKELEAFTREQLGATLRAVRTLIGDQWITIDDADQEVVLHHTPAAIVERYEAEVKKAVKVGT